jgi:acyl-homoserine lactone acylase PvdQ
VVAQGRTLREVSVGDLNGDGGKAMSTETRMAIEQSTSMPQRSESDASVRYETKVLSQWDRQALAEVDAAFTYEIAWIPERQCWRSFLCSVSKLA